MSIGQKKRDRQLISETLGVDVRGGDGWKAKSDNADKSIRLAKVTYNDGVFRTEKKLICPIGVEPMASS